MHLGYAKNRYRRHAPLGDTPYESAVGKTYLEKIAPIGEYTFALSEEAREERNCELDWWKPREELPRLTCGWCRE